MHEADIRDQWIRVSYNQIMQEVEQQAIEIENARNQLEKLRKRSSSLKNMLYNLKEKIIEGQNHPYALMVDKETAKHILQEMLEDINGV